MLGTMLSKIDVVSAGHIVTSRPRVDRAPGFARVCIYGVPDYVLVNILFLPIFQKLFFGVRMGETFGWELLKCVLMLWLGL